MSVRDLRTTLIPRTRLAALTLAATAALGVLGHGTADAMASASGDSHAGRQTRAEGAAKAPVRAADVIDLAMKQVGVREDATGNTKFNQWYSASEAAKLTAQRDGGTTAGYNAAEWCDMFVSWAAAQTGAQGMGADAYTVTHAKWFQKTKRWGTTPKPGAAVFFAWNGGGVDGIDHIGLVIKDNHDGTISTVEGNTDNAVKIKTRSTDTVVGYGYPDYAK